MAEESQMQEPEPRGRLYGSPRSRRCLVADRDIPDPTRLCPACALAARTESRLYHVRCLGPERCDCTHDALKEVLFRG